MKKFVSYLTLLPFVVTLFSCSKGGDVDNNSLVLTGIDGGIAMKWDAVENAESYLIYNGDKQIDEVSLNFTTVNFLENGQEYKLGVAAKTKSGISKIVYKTAKPDEMNDYDPFTDDLNSSLEELIGSAKIQQMYKAANLNASSANTYRYKRVINNMKQGVSQTIGYIGGSITVGETATKLDDKGHQKGYARYSYEWLRSHYDKEKNSKFINASISGTDTCIASVRLEKDLLQYNPDLVFVEFCANNSTSTFDQKSYESVIRRILNQPNEPTVILLYSSTNYSRAHQEAYMRPMGEYYNVPRFSMVDAMIKACDAKSDGSDLTRENNVYSKFTDDGTHPNNLGHQLYAKTLATTLRALAKRTPETSYTVPASPTKSRNDDYVNMTYVNNCTNNEIIKSTGSFVASDTKYRVLTETADVEAYQKGWIKSSKSSNDSMKLTVTAKNFFIIYLAGNAEVAGDPEGRMVATYQNTSTETDKGSLDWNVEKTCKQSSISQVNENDKGWQNPCCIILFDNESAATYDIEIKMDQNSSLGTLLAFGYCA